MVIVISPAFALVQVGCAVATALGCAGEFIEGTLSTMTGDKQSLASFITTV